MPNRGKTAASKNPPDPFRPHLANPKMGGNNAQMQTQSPMGKQLVPLSDGKREFRLPDMRKGQGFAGVARRMRMDRNQGTSGEFPRQKER